MIGMTTPDVMPALYGGSISFPPFSFDMASAQDVLRQATEAAQQQKQSNQPLPPFTLFGRPGFDGDGAVVFQTREGGVGVLQITGYTDNPRGVKIRYRLVQTRAPVPSQASEPSDLREARAKLAELRVTCGEHHPGVQGALARVKVLERMTKEEPDAPVDLREARAHLAELLVTCGEQHPSIQGALARIKALEQK